MKGDQVFSEKETPLKAVEGLPAQKNSHIKYIAIAYHKRFPQYMHIYNCWCVTRYKQNIFSRECHDKEFSVPVTRLGALQAKDYSARTDKCRSKLEGWEVLVQ